MAVLKYLICGYLIGQKWLKMAKMAKIGQKMVKKIKKVQGNFQLVNGLKGEGMSFIWSLVGKIVANGSRNSLTW